ncbi:hypothetical protein HK102_006360 [Quaeritorhiza haematococci]|nr:hypothetical protein HK102_006360 [Quaeritorhiza haematococci]
MILCLIWVSLLSRLAPGLTSSFVYMRVFAKDPTVPPEARLFVNIGLMLRPFVPLIGITLFFASLLRFKIIVVIKNWSMAWYKGVSVTATVIATMTMSYYIIWPVMDTVLVNKGLPASTAQFHAQLGKMPVFIPFGLMMLAFYIADITLGITVFLLIRKASLNLTRNINSSMPGQAIQSSQVVNVIGESVPGTIDIMSSTESKPSPHLPDVSLFGGSKLLWLKSRIGDLYGETSRSDESTKTGSAERNLQILQRNLQIMTIVLAFAIFAPIFQAVLFTVGVTANFTGLTYIKAHTEATIVAVYAAITVFMQIHFLLHYFIGIETLVNFKDHPAVTDQGATITTKITTMKRPTTTDDPIATNPATTSKRQKKQPTPSDQPSTTPQSASSAVLAHPPPTIPINRHKFKSRYLRKHASLLRKSDPARGLLISCNVRQETRALGQARSFLDHYLPLLFPSHQPLWHHLAPASDVPDLPNEDGSENDEDQDTTKPELQEKTETNDDQADSTQASNQKEEEPKEKQREDRKFQAVDTACAGVIFLRFRVDVTPVEFLDKLFDHFLTLSKQEQSLVAKQLSFCSVIR